MWSTQAGVVSDNACISTPVPTMPCAVCMHVQQSCLFEMDALAAAALRRKPVNAPHRFYGLYPIFGRGFVPKSSPRWGVFYPLYGFEMRSNSLSRRNEYTGWQGPEMCKKWKNFIYLSQDQLEGGEWAQSIKNFLWSIFGTLPMHISGQKAIWGQNFKIGKLKI